MMKITDYTAGHEKVLGPYKEIRFLCINQSFPVQAVEPTVTFSVIVESGELDTVTVSLIHTIESVDD